MTKLYPVMIALVLVLAACGGGTPLVSEDFQEIEALPESIRAEGLQTILTQEGRDTSILRLIVEQPGRNESGLLWLDAAEPPADASLAVRARLRAGQLRLWLRTDERLCAGYVLIIDPTLDRYRLSTTEPDCSLRTLADRSRMEVNLEEWHDIRIEARGNTVRGIIDSVEFFTIEDETYTTGSAALQAYTDGLAPAQVDLDWLRLEG